MSPGTELARDFCAGIGPLQLGVVLVFIVKSITVFCLLQVAGTSRVITRQELNQG